MAYMFISTLESEHDSNIYTRELLKRKLRYKQRIKGKKSVTVMIFGRVKIGFGKVFKISGPIHTKRRLLKHKSLHNILALDKGITNHGLTMNDNHI